MKRLWPMIVVMFILGCGTVAVKPESPVRAEALADALRIEAASLKAVKATEAASVIAALGLRLDGYVAQARKIAAEATAAAKSLADAEAAWAAEKAEYEKRLAAAESKAKERLFYALTGLCVLGIILAGLSATWWKSLEGTFFGLMVAGICFTLVVGGTVAAYIVGAILAIVMVIVAIILLRQVKAKAKAQEVALVNTAVAVDALKAAAPPEAAKPIFEALKTSNIEAGVQGIVDVARGLKR